MKFKDNNYSNLGKTFFVLLVLLGLLNFSCEKFVDVKKNSAQSLIETAADCQLVLDNYNVMNVGYPSDGELSADDYYLNDAGYLSSTLGSTDRDMYTWQSTAFRPGAQPQWLIPYKVVYHANLIMETVDKLKGSTDQKILDGLRGQSLFFRAYAFWQVAQLYTKPYVVATADQSPGIPLRLSSDINEKSDRGTLKQTYARIIQDLNEASSLLPDVALVSSRPSKGATYAMLARVYLSMEDYTAALTSATLALQINNQLLDYNTLSATSSTPFSRFNKEVLFHSVMNPGPTLNPGTATSNIAKIDPVLVNSYSTNDLRKQLFLKANSGVDAGTFRFSGNYEPAASASFFDGLAVDELFLIRAECYARAGNINSAMADLNTLLKTRWLSGVYVDMVSSTADEALSKVLIERRKELLMRGLRWTDLRRLNLDSRFAKTLSRTINGVTYTLPPNDLRYTLLIPDEVIANSNFAIQQNPR